MPNERKIIDRRVHDSGLELDCHELEQMLEAELSKPAEQMDMQLVRELLALLQPGQVPDAEKEQVWQNVSRVFRSKRTKTTSVLRRLAVIAAILVLLFGLTIGAASALRWTFLWKLLQPVAETFGIYMNYPDDQPADTVSENLYGISEDENATQVCYDLSLIPDEYDGYAIKPAWIPEGYTFAYGSSFKEVNFYKYTLNFQRGTDELNVFVSIFTDSGTMSSHLYERAQTKVSEKEIESKTVTFYRNAKDQIQSVSWVDGNLHYLIIGNVTQEEICEIVTGFLVHRTE